MADLFDRYGVDAGKAGPDLFDRYGPNTGGVQDYEPMDTRHVGTVELPKDDAAAWVVTRLRKAGASIGGIPRAMADAVKYGVDAVGLPPRYANAINFANPVTAVGQYMPSTGDINETLAPVFPTYNAPGTVGKIVDAGVESAIGGLALGGGATSILPSLVGGSASEVAGMATKGTPYEPFARVATGIAAGGATALGQNAAGNVLRGVNNLRGANVDETASRIYGRALQRDNMTPEELVARQKALGPGATAAEAGGPNFRGMVQGSIAAPGEARAKVQNVFDARRAELPERTSNALNASVTPQGSVAQTVDELAALRKQQASPLYESAGIPRSSADDVISTTPLQSPTITSPNIEFLLKNSPDVRAAIGAARRLPQFKDLPDNSMVMLDKAYKHLNGMEQEAIRAGNNTRAFDLKNLRQSFQKALTEANPKYQEALDAYSGPSKLITATERGKEWFTKKVDPYTVRAEFQAMSPDEQQAALIGARDWARGASEETRVGIPSDKVFGSASVQKRWEAILKPGEYNALADEMKRIRNVAETSADIRVGSRTTPMALNAADNALQAGNPMVEAVTKGPRQALTNAIRNYAERLTEGRTEAVNAKLAEWATMTDPAQVGLVKALANRALLEEAARKSARGNALVYGAAAPAVNAATGARQ